jgi:hypothetical protein
MFTPKEIETIDTCHNGDIEMIRNTNYDGSIQIDVFDLYKCHKEGNYLVVELGDIRKEGSIQECLDFIHKWL